MNALLPRLRLRVALPALAALLAGGCVTVRTADDGIARGHLGETLRSGPVALVLTELVEDSRCPINARCVWPGRLVVTTRIDGAGWRDTADLTLGEPFGTHDIVIALVSGEPGRMAGADKETPPDAYRLTYEPREGAPR